MEREKKHGAKEDQQSQNLRQLVTFNLGTEEYGVDIMSVQEIIRCQAITHVPQMPGFIEGVINLRGNVIPVIDLRKRFGMTVTDQTAQTRIVVVNVGAKVIGVVVDAVSEVMRLAEEQIEPPPPVVAGIGNEYLQGVGKVQGRLIILLNLDRILSNQEHEKLTQIRG